MQNDIKYTKEERAEIESLAAAYIEQKAAALEAEREAQRLHYKALNDLKEGLMTLLTVGDDKGHPLINYEKWPQAVITETSEGRKYILFFDTEETLNPTGYREADF